MDKGRDVYVPAIKYRSLTFLYDIVMRWALRESTFKRRLVEQARIERGHRVLDVGCGTGTLMLLINRLQPEAEVVGLDGDPRILKIARAKAARAGFAVALDHGMSFALPYADKSFDRVFSSLLFHHLTRENKLRTLAEVFRVLRPGGELHVADWGKAQNWLMHQAYRFVQMVDGIETTADHAQGALAELIRSAGFEDVRESARYMTVAGTLALYRARKSG